MNQMLRCSLLSTNKNLTPAAFLKPAFTIIAIVFSIGFAVAQKPAHAGKAKTEMKLCGTMEGIAERMKTDPVLRARVEQNERDYQNWLNNPSSNNVANGGVTNSVAWPGYYSCSSTYSIAKPMDSYR